MIGRVEPGKNVLYLGVMSGINHHFELVEGKVFVMWFV